MSMKTKKEMVNDIADSDILLVCSICRKEFEHTDEYYSYLNSHSIPSTSQSLTLKPFKCESCSYVCYSGIGLDTHKA